MSLIDVVTASVELGDVLVLDAVSLTVDEGECIEVSGRNGSGKSTLLRLLAGLVRPVSGTVRTGRRDGDIGYVPDVAALYDMLTVREHLDFLAALQGGRREDVDGLLANVDLVPQEHLYAKDLSLGQRRRLSLAMALSGDPTVLLLDEPFNGLDAQSHDRLVASLQQHLRRGGAAVLATHHVSAPVVTRRLRVDRGALLDQPVGRVGEPVATAVWGDVAG